MAIRPDKDVLNEHAKFTKFDKYKQKPEIMKVADISQQDIDARGLKTFKKYDLDTLKELEQLKKVSKDKQELEPTGKFVK